MHKNMLYEATLLAALWINIGLSQLDCAYPTSNDLETVINSLIIPENSPGSVNVKRYAVSGMHLKTRWSIKRDLC